MATTDTLDNGATGSAYRFGNRRPESTARYATASLVYERHEQQVRSRPRRSASLRISYQPLVSARWRKPSSLLLSERDFAHLQDELQAPARVLPNLARAAEREHARGE